MSAWLRRYVFEACEAAGEVATTHLLTCGHRRRPLFTPMGFPRRWQYCPTCYRARRPPAAPPAPVALVRCSPDDARWLFRTLESLIRRGDLEHVDSARRVALAAESAAKNPVTITSEATHAT